MCTRRSARSKTKLRSNRRAVVGRSSLVVGKGRWQNTAFLRRIQRSVRERLTTGDCNCNSRTAQQVAQRLRFGLQFVGEISAFFDRFLETALRFIRPVGDGFQGVIVGAPQVFPQLFPGLWSEQQTEGSADTEPDQQESDCRARRTLRTLVFSYAHNAPPDQLYSRPEC